MRIAVIGFQFRLGSSFQTLRIEPCELYQPLVGPSLVDTSVCNILESRNSAELRISRSEHCWCLKLCLIILVFCLLVCSNDIWNRGGSYDNCALDYRCSEDCGWSIKQGCIGGHATSFNIISSSTKKNEAIRN